MTTEREPAMFDRAAAASGCAAATATVVLGGDIICAA